MSPTKGNKMKEDILKIAARFNDIFPKAQLTLGGSAALEIQSPGRCVKPRDIDFYLKLEITRVGFREVLETIIFKDEDIMFEDKEYDRVPEHARYLMPCISRRIKVVRFEGPDIDFIFTKSMHTVPQWLLKNQASTLTELCYKMDTYNDPFKHVVSSDEFKLVMGGYKGVILQIDPKVCSSDHAIRVVDRCNRMGFEVRKV